MGDHDQTKVLLDGKFVDWKDANLHVSTHAFLYGTAVFEGIRAYWSEKEQQLNVWYLREHAERLERNARMMGFDKAPTAELRENQRDEDTLPPYDELDRILQALVEGEASVADVVAQGHDRATVKRVEAMLYQAEYKRRQAAPGVKITPRHFGRDRRYPITNRFRDMS